MPIRSKTIMNLTNLILGTVWLIGLLLARLFCRISEATPLEIGNETIWVCQETVSESEAKILVVIIFSVTFLVPIGILAYVYSSMALVIFRRDLKNSASL